jgi:hypothetical protein
LSGALRTAPDRCLDVRGLRLGASTDYAAMTSKARLSLAIVRMALSELWFKTIIPGGAMPSESKSFTPSSILFRPHQEHRPISWISNLWLSADSKSLFSFRVPVGRALCSWWRRRVPPPSPTLGGTEHANIR